MNTRIFETYDMMCRRVADEIEEDLKKNPQQMLCIAAGHTSLGVFKYLIQDYEQDKVDFSQAWFAAMDEWLYMSDKTKESCGYFLREHFLDHVNYAPDHIRLWNGAADNVQEECAQVEAFIKDHSVNGTLDYLVLGAGMNGHLALNEPGTSFNSRAHVTVLDPITQKVGQKYFSDKTALSGGITLGIDNFRQARRTVLMVNGSAKSEILSKILTAGAPNEQIPATALLTFENASLYCDRDALGKD